MAATSTITLSLLAELTATADLAANKSTINYPKSFSFTDGEGANMIESLWQDQRTLAASASETLDLYGGLTNAFGATISFNKIKALLISAAAANTNNVLVGGNASNAFVNWVANSSDIVVVRPGGLLLLVAPGATGYGVSSGTGDILKVANSSSGTSVTYDIVLLGEVA